MKKRWMRILSLALSGSLLLAGGAAVGEESVFTQEMVDRSLISVGNTQRLHRAIEKGQRGEEVSIVYLGGSITEGAGALPKLTGCYAALSARMFADRFMSDPGKLKYRNAGISGTPSLLGITRCEKDVLAYQPDIVFVEFAVNDSTDAESQMAYESLVAKLLQSESAPAVILLFTLMDSGYSAHVHMKQIGWHYDLGMISVYDAVQPQLLTKKMQWSDYSADYAHPNNAGHAFIAGLIGNYFDKAAATEPVEYVLPEDARYGRELENLVNVKKEDPAIIAQGGFPFGPASCYSYFQGWRRIGVEGNEPLTLSVTASYLTIAFKQENSASCGKAEVWVDGEMKAALPGSAGNAWGNIITRLIPLGQYGEHTIQIKMAEGDETKKFTLLDIACAGE